MNKKSITALLIAVLGLVLVVAGPLLPGGERLIRNDPPRSGHVTDLALADDGSALAGTQDGELWRLADGAWSKVDVDLNGKPVTSLSADLSGDPAQGPIGTGGGLVNAPAGMPPLDVRVSDETATRNGLVVATGEGLRVQSDGAWASVQPEIYFYRLEPQTQDDVDYVHAGTVGHGVYTAEVDDLLSWQPNSEGLPEGGNVFTFVVTAGGRLIAGTDRGLYWQPAPMRPWQPLQVGLEQSRMLSLYLAPPGEDERQRLWIGSDKALYRVDLTEDTERVEAVAYAELIPAVEKAGPDDVRYGISWIMPYDDGVLFSSGAVYQYGPMGLAGWYWVSLAGIALILAGGWLYPGRETPEQPAAT